MVVVVVGYVLEVVVLKGHQETEQRVLGDAKVVKDVSVLPRENRNKRTRCSGKIVFFFPIHCNPSLAYIAARDLQSSQRNTSSVQSLLLAGNFLYNQ